MNEQGNCENHVMMMNLIKQWHLSKMFERTSLMRSLLYWLAYSYTRHVGNFTTWSVCINVERRLSRQPDGLTWQFDQKKQSNGGEKKNPKAELDRRAVSVVGTVSGGEQGLFKGEIRFKDHGTRTDP